MIFAMTGKPWQKKKVFIMNLWTFKHSLLSLRAGCLKNTGDGIPQTKGQAPFTDAS